MYQVRHGDCLAVMADMADNSVDSIVTDPPYGLEFMGKDWDAPWKTDRRQVFDGTLTDTRENPFGRSKVRHGTGGSYGAGAGVMQAYQAWATEIFTEALRVLKPGGHLLAFGGSRTYHRLACAIEDAGFEIRDQIMWLYGSGFPKSMDVSKAIDKAAGVERKTPPGRHASTGSAVAIAGGDGRCATCGRHRGSQAANCQCLKHSAPATPEAQQWQGWGTALKPAHEPIVVARKPLIGTVAKNVLEHGTGALNIDGCRVPTNETITNHARGAESAVSKGKYGDSKAQETHQTEGQSLGRFPANVIHDGSDEVLAGFPDAPGQQGYVGPEQGSRPSKHAYGDMKSRPPSPPRADSGSAARFFYCAKASKKDRNAGCVNKHPTVKPTELMRYLCRLVTPPGGIVFDPFAGSGSTGRGAVLEGFHFIGAEMDPAYVRIANGRIRAAARQVLRRAA